MALIKQGDKVFMGTQVERQASIQELVGSTSDKFLIVFFLPGFRSPREAIFTTKKKFDVFFMCFYFLKQFFQCFVENIREIKIAFQMFFVGCVARKKYFSPV